MILQRGFLVRHLVTLFSCTISDFGVGYTSYIITLIFTLTGTLNRIRVKTSVGNIGIFDTKWAFCVNKSFKNTIYSRFLEFKSRLAHQKETDIRKDIRFLFYIAGGT